MTPLSQSCASFGSQDYTRATLDLDAVPELVGTTVPKPMLGQGSSQYSSVSWSGIGWSDEAPETTSPIKESEPEREHEESDEEQDQEEDEEDEGPFVPYTQSSVVRPITWGYYEPSQSYGSNDYATDPAIMDLLDRIDGEDAARRSVSSTEPIESFSSSSVARTPHALVASYTSSPISSFSQEIAQEDSDLLKANRSISTGQSGLKDAQPSTPASLSRSETYSTVDFGEGVLNLKNLSQRTLKAIDAIEASFPNNKNKRKLADSDPVTPKKQISKKPRLGLSPKKSKIGVDLEVESSALECSLCGKLLANPQISSTCGHTLGCNACVVQWVIKKGSQPKCPQNDCSAIIDSIIPNYGLRELIGKHVTLLHDCYLEWDEEKGKLRKDWAKRMV